MVTRESAIAAGIDYDEGLERFVGRADLYERFLSQFPEEHNFYDLKRELEAGNVGAAFKYAHALKGVVGNLSMNFFFESISALVEELRNGRIENVQELFPMVEEQYHALVQALRE